MVRTFLSHIIAHNGLELRQGIFPLFDGHTVQYMAHHLMPLQCCQTTAIGDLQIGTDRHTALAEMAGKGATATQCYSIRCQVKVSLGIILAKLMDFLTGKRTQVMAQAQYLTYRDATFFCAATAKESQEAADHLGGNCQQRQGELLDDNA